VGLSSDATRKNDFSSALLAFSLDLLAFALARSAVYGLRGGGGCGDVKGNAGEDEDEGKTK